MKRKFKPAVIALFIIGAGGAALISCQGWNNNSGEKIVISGNIELTQVKLAFKTPGRLILLPIEEGSEISRGAVVARLDAAQLQKQLDRERASLAAAESQLPQLRTSIEYQRAALAAEIELRRAAVKQAEAGLAQLLAGARSQEINQVRAAADEARTRHELARQDWERAQVLYGNDDISTSQRDQYKALLDAAAANLRQVEERLALVVEGPRKEDIDGARARLEQARAALQLAEAARLEIKRREQEIVTRDAQVDQAKAQVAVVESQLDDMAIAAPVNGVVLVKSAEVGEVLAAGTIVATLGEMDKPWVRGYIDEKDLGRVKLGSTVRVTSDSYAGKSYPGRISFIASEAEFTPKQIQTQEERVKLVYRLKIEVENPRHELKLNMPVEAEIDLPPE